jgi:hypothetical protein
VGRGSPTASSCRSGPSSSVDGTSSPATMEEDTNNDLLDYEPSPAHNDIEVNVVHLSSIDYSLLEEEEVSQLALGQQDAIFKKPAELEDHLKPLYIHGLLNGMLVAHMLVDGGAAMNAMHYSTFKKLGKTDAELVKMNMTFTGIGGDGPIGPKGILIQWVGEEVEIVHADLSTCVAMTDSSYWSHYNIKCLLGQDISDCDFVSASKDGFIPIFIKPIDD